MKPADAFSQSYAEARAKFRVTAEAAGAAITVLPHPLKGPAGEDLACDVARFGPHDARNVLLVNSATHGAEGFCGSGSQIGLMALGWHRRLPKDTALVLSHAINPYGFAHLRRVNEDNVDLNRNFGDHSQPRQRNAAYAEVHPWLLPDDWDGPARQAADAAIDAYIEKYGHRQWHAAVATGQADYPDGLFYAGKAPTWSNLTLRALLEAHLAGARQFCFFDIHTGLGPSGYGEPSYVGKQNEADFAEAQAWLGPDVTWLDRGTGQSTPLDGHIGLPFRAFYDKGLTGPVIGIEFGTVPSPEVHAALRADHWMHRAGTRDTEQGRAAARRLRDAFYTDTDTWKDQVIRRVDELTGRALAGMAGAGLAG